MHRFVVAVVVAAALLCPAAPASAAPPLPAAVFAPIGAWVKMANAGDRAGLIALFTADGSSVDNFAPYRFAAPNGAAHWYDGFVADADAQRETDGIISIRPPTFFHVTGDRAWAVVPTRYRYTLRGTPELETGSLVFTLARTGGVWKLTSMSWSQASDTGPRDAPAPQAPALLATIAAFVKAGNAGERAALFATFAPDAALVDEFAPYRFAPPSGPAKWYAGAAADSIARRMTDGANTLGAPIYVRVTGTHAWVVIAADYRFHSSGVLHVEHGAPVFTLSHTAAGWKITTMAWALLGASPAP
jgi:ketosteroid isomerase-like protein